MRIFISTFLFLISVIHAEIPTLSFQHLEGLVDHLSPEAATLHLERSLLGFHNHEIRMRGFLYLNKDGQWVLSSESNLRTCCVGSAKKISQQVVLKDLEILEAPTKVVTVEGHFAIMPLWDQQGTLTQLYVLQKTHLLHDEFPYTSIALAGVGVGAAAFLCLLMRKKV